MGTTTPAGCGHPGWASRRTPSQARRVQQALRRQLDSCAPLTRCSAGSLATVLGPHFKQSQPGAKATMRSLQCSHRPGSLDVEVCGEEVRITGATTMVYAGQLLL